MSSWMSLSAVDHIRELNWISDEEEGSIVANYVIDALLSVKLDGKSTRISVSVREASLTEGSRESNHDLRFLSLWAIKNASLGPLRAIIEELEVAIAARSHSMDHSFSDTLSVKLSQLVNKMDVG